MTTDDRLVFGQSMARLARAFRVRLRPAELDDLSDTYFKILHEFDLKSVLAAGKVCLETRRSFPKAADWLLALSNSGHSGPPDCRVMTADEAREYLRAEALRYQDEPCNCLTCQAASVTMLPLRFVPECTADGHDERAYHPVKQKVVTSGRWIHGDDLRRWWLAREACFAVAPSVFRRLLRNPQIGLEREPGCDD